VREAPSVPKLRPRGRWSGRRLVASLLPWLPALAGCQGGQSPGAGRTPLPTPSPAPPAALAQPLVDAARVVDRRVGAAVQSGLLASEPLYASTLTTHFDAVTAEWEMKWDVNEPEPGRFDFTRGDRIVAFAEARGMWIRGHTLVWHRQLPGWVGELSSGELRIALEDHIRGVAGHYAGRVAAWDVVNEAVADDGGGLRETPFLRGLGPDYIAEAFRLARAADPQARLYYNDYGAEGLGPKSDRVFELVRDLVRRGVPIDGVGLQMHVQATRPPRVADVAANMRRLAELGLSVDISEMDVRIRELPGNTGSRLEEQRRLYRDLVRVCVAEPACDGVTFWGFTDAHSWIDEAFGADDPL
jgi:endo-1,4-beta-xylanase